MHVPGTVIPGGVLIWHPQKLSLRQQASCQTDMQTCSEAQNDTEQAGCVPPSAPPSGGGGGCAHDLVESQVSSCAVQFWHLAPSLPHVSGASPPAQKDAPMTVVQHPPQFTKLHGGAMFPLSVPPASIASPPVGASRTPLPAASLESRASFASGGTTVTSGIVESEAVASEAAASSLRLPAASLVDGPLPPV